MTIHAIVQYLEYRWKAKGRHGTHSPFVYDFVEHVLMDSDVIAREYIVACPNLPLRFENIVSRMAAYYRYQHVLQLPFPKEVAKEKVDMLLLNESNPKEWIGLLDKYSSLLKNESAVVVSGIHTTAGHTAAWTALCNDHRTKMSMDLYGIGILLYRDEFKERQHFVLKY